eukprot:g18917.t1
MPLHVPARSMAEPPGVEDIQYPVPLFVHNTFIEAQTGRPASLEGFFHERQEKGYLRIFVRGSQSLQTGSGARSGYCVGEMGTEEKRSEGLTKRFDGDGASPSKDYERWKRWCRAFLVVQKAKGIPVEAHGSLIFALLDGTALRALDTITMDRIEVAGGEDVIFQALDERFPAEASHDRLGKVLDQIFDLRVEKGESTAIYTGKARAAFSAAEAEGVSLPEVAKGYLMLRFAKLSPERKAVVLAAARQSYKENDIAAALRTTYPDNLYQASKQTATYRVDSEEPMEEHEPQSEEDTFEAYLADAGYATEDEVEEQDAVDALLTWKQTRAGINQTKMSRGFGNGGAPGRDFKKLESRVRCFRCKQVGHFSKNCPKKGKGGSKGHQKESGSVNTKVNYVWMVWSNDFFEPEMTISPTGYTETETFADGAVITRHHPPPALEHGRPLTGQEMHALVAGWEYRPRDFWHVQGNRVIREHLLPRRQLFTPAASGCPIPIEDLCETRTTKAIKNNGETSVLFAHNWKHRGEAHRKLDFEWSGQTIFYMREAEIGPTDEELVQMAISYKDELDLAQEEMLQSPADSEESEEEESLVALVHSPGHGVVDTGCGRGLIGEDTLKRHEAVLAEYNLKVKELPHKPHAFRYGNGASDKSFRTVQIPIFLAGVKMWLRMHVVPGQVPLLLSKRFLKALGAVMDLQQGELLLKRAHLAVPLLEQRDGSYQINLLDMNQPAKVQDVEVEVMHTEVWQGEMMEEERSFTPDPEWSPMGDGEEVELEGAINVTEEFDETIMDDENPDRQEDELPEERTELQCGEEEEEDEGHYEVETEEEDLDNRTGSQPAEEPEGELSEAEDDGDGERHVMRASDRKSLQRTMTQVLQTTTDVDAWPSCVEIFCPGRFGEKAEAFGVRGAKAFDLSTGWDWKRAEDRKAVWTYLEKFDPDLTIMSPPCGPLSRLQNSTPPWRRQDIEQFNREKVEAKAMVAWCARIARDRMRKGRLFVFESSKTSASWREPGLQDLMGYDECHRVDVPACSVGLRDRESKKLFGKEWGFLTNGPGISADAMDILRGAMKSNVYHLNNESVMLQSAAEQRALRARKKNQPKDFGSEVLWIQDYKTEETMVKVSAKGFTEDEVRALFENMVSRHAKTSEEFLAHIHQSRAACKAKIPLHMVNSKMLRGETGLATFTYTKTTQMIAVQAGAAFLDVIEDTMIEVMEKYGSMLKHNEILPMKEGTGEWSEAFRMVLHEGARSHQTDDPDEGNAPRRMPYMPGEQLVRSAAFGSQVKADESVPAERVEAKSECSTVDTGPRGRVNAELPVLRLETALSSVPLEERETRASSFGRRRTARFGFDSRLKSRLFRSGLLFWHVIGDVVPFCCTLRCWEQPQF